MLKTHCDKCEAVIDDEKFTFTYERRQSYDYKKVDLCKGCLRTFEKGDLPKLMQLADKKKKSP